MKINGNKKTIKLESWVEVFNVWAEPSTYDYRSGGDKCIVYAAMEYANVTAKEAAGWSFDFNKSGYEEMFHQLNAACDNSCSHFNIDDGTEYSDGRGRESDDPILRVAKAYSKNPDDFDVELYESESGIPFVKFERNGKAFEFSILEDYAMFRSFDGWLKRQAKLEREEAKRKSAEAFLAEL